MGYLFFLSPGCAALVLLKDSTSVFCPLLSISRLPNPMLPTMVEDRTIILTKKWQACSQEADSCIQIAHQVAGCKDYPSPRESYTPSTTKVNFLILRALALLRLLLLWWGLLGRRLCIVMCKGLGVERIHHALM